MKSSIAEIEPNELAQRVAGSPACQTLLALRGNKPLRDFAISSLRPAVLEQIEPWRSLFADPALVGKFTAATPRAWARLYDPASPTVGIMVPWGMCGGSLLSLASAWRRSQGELAANVLYLPLHIADSTVVRGGKEGSRTLFAQRVIAVDRQGRVQDVTLGDALRIDVLLGHGRLSGTMQQQLECLALQGLNPWRVDAALRDKLEGKRLAKQFGLHIPAHVELTAADLSHLSAEWLCDRCRVLGAEGIVIKPVDDSQGRNVSLHPPDAWHEAARAAGKLLSDYGRAIVEQRIRAHPTVFRERDWNIRVFAGKQGLVDVLVRIGRDGQPVGMNRGGDAWELEEIIRALRPVEGVRAPAAAALRAELEAQFVPLARSLDSLLLGADVILSDDGRLWVLEINGAGSGGLDTLASIRPALADKLRGPALLHAAVLESSRPSASVMPAAMAGIHHNPLAAAVTTESWVLSDYLKLVANYTASNGGGDAQLLETLESAFTDVHDALHRHCRKRVASALVGAYARLRRVEEAKRIDGRYFRHQRERLPHAEPLTQLYEELGEVDQAFELYRTLVAEKPEYPPMALLQRIIRRAGEVGDQALFSEAHALLSAREPQFVRAPRGA